MGQHSLIPNWFCSTLTAWLYCSVLPHVPMSLMEASLVPRHGRADGQPSPPSRTSIHPTPTTDNHASSLCLLKNPISSNTMISSTGPLSSDVGVAAKR